MTVLNPIGQLLAGAFRFPSTANKIISVGQSTGIYDESADTNKYNRSNIRQTRIGQGSTPAQRTDTNVETPFVVGVEAGFVNAQDSAYIAGLAKAESSTLFSPTGGNGTVTEVFRQFRMWFGSGGGSFVPKAGLRDVIDGVPFVSGESIFVNNEAFI
jgi:hypothetical protein